MKKIIILSSVLAIIFLSCKDKKPTDPFFPVLSFLESQVADVDSSLYQIVQIDIRDSVTSDTTYLRREQFRKAASDFLEIPDLTKKEYAGRYKEEKLFDTMIKRAILVYLPLNPDDEIVQRQELVLKPDMHGGNGELNSVIIDLLIVSKDSSVHKRMLWQTDRSFQVTTIKQKPGEPESVVTKKVAWNGQENL